MFAIALACLLLLSTTLLTFQLSRLYEIDEDIKKAATVIWDIRR